MLVLSRRKNDGVVIDQDITIKVLEVQGNQVRIGIEAPKDLSVLRGELASARTTEMMMT